MTLVALIGQEYMVNYAPFLKKDGKEVETFPTAYEAAQKLQSQKYDLIIMQSRITPSLDFDSEELNQVLTELQKDHVVGYGEAAAIILLRMIKSEGSLNENSPVILQDNGITDNLSGLFYQEGVKVYLHGVQEADDYQRAVKKALSK